MRSRCGWYQSRAWRTWPGHGRCGSVSACSSACSLLNGAAIGCGGEKPLSALTAPSCARSSSTHLRALTGPMPGSSCSTRNAARELRRLSAQRSTASMSLMCAASRNFRPPYFTNGMRRRASSTSSTSLALALRNSTAWRRSATPASRRLRIWPHTYSACPARSSSVAYSGLPPAPRVDSRCLRCWRGASAIRAFEASSNPWVER